MLLFLSLQESLKVFNEWRLSNYIRLFFSSEIWISSYGEIIEKLSGSLIVLHAIPEK